MNIAVDFDCTCVRQAKFPGIGEDVPYAVDALKSLIAAGHKIILWTVRSGPALDKAKQWFEDRNIELYSVNVKPGQRNYSLSPKLDYDLLIDDKAYGVPLILIPGDTKKVVDWRKVKKEYGKRRTFMVNDYDALTDILTNEDEYERTVIDETNGTYAVSYLFQKDTQYRLDVGYTDDGEMIQIFPMTAIEYP